MGTPFESAMGYRTKTVLAVALLALLSCSAHDLDQEEESTRVGWTSQLVVAASGSGSASEQKAKSAKTSALRWVHKKGARFPWYFDSKDKRPSDKDKVRYPRSGEVQDHALPQRGERKNRRKRSTYKMKRY